MAVIRRATTVFQEPDVCDDIELLHELSPGESIEQTIRFDGTTTWGPFLDQAGGEATLVLEPGLYQAIGGISADLINPSAPVDLRIRS